MVAGWNPCFPNGFTSSTFPIQPDFSQNQPAAITLNTGSPRTLHWSLVFKVLSSMSGENQRLVADEPVEFEKQLVEVGDFKRITNHSRRIYK